MRDSVVLVVKPQADGYCSSATLGGVTCPARGKREREREVQSYLRVTSWTGKKLQKSQFLWIYPLGPVTVRTIEGFDAILESVFVRFRADKLKIRWFFFSFIELNVSPEVNSPRARDAYEDFSQKNMGRFPGVSSGKVIFFIVSWIPVSYGR